MVNVKLLKSLRPKVYEDLTDGAGYSDESLEQISAKELIDAWLTWEGIQGYTDAILRLVSAVLAATGETVYGIKFEPETFNPEDHIKAVSEKLNLEIDFPSCFFLPVDDCKHLVFGYANEGLGYNLVDNETGEVFDVGELSDEIETTYQDTDKQLKYIRKICAKYHVELL